MGMGIRRILLILSISFISLGLAAQTNLIQAEDPIHKGIVSISLGLLFLFAILFISLSELC